MTEPLPRFLTRSSAAAVAAVTFAGVANVILAPEPLPAARLGIVVALALAHGVLGTAGLYVVERRADRGRLHVHFALALLVAVGAVAASRGGAALLLMSLIAQSVLYLGVAGVVGVVSVAMVATFVTHGVSGPPPWHAGFVAAVAFVIVFARMLLSQHRARLEMERLAQELTVANERLRDYANDVEELAMTRERNRVAREIHDGLGHFLTVVHVQLEAARATLRSDPAKAEAAVLKAQELTRDGLAEVRRSVGMLRGPLVSRPLVEMLETLAEECTSSGIRTRVAVDGTVRALSPPAEFTLFRAAQEALTNVRRHARASAVTIGLAYLGGDRVKLRVEDDGVGTDAPAEGFGLLGLRERALSVGGRVVVHSARGRGFALEVEVPA